MNSPGLDNSPQVSHKAILHAVPITLPEINSTDPAHLSQAILLYFSLHTAGKFC